MIVSSAIEKMIAFYQGNLHDINHFLKVWAFAKTIGEQEGLDDQTQLTLELAAVVHDIACPLCRQKYGNANGKYQELESPPLVEGFFADMPVERDMAERISWLVAHHHTYTHVDGLYYQILWKRIFWSTRMRAALPAQPLKTCGKAFFAPVRAFVCWIAFICGSSEAGKNPFVKGAISDR